VELKNVVVQKEPRNDALIKEKSILIKNNFLFD